VKNDSAIDDLEASRDELVALRHAIHQNPEIGHKEFNTAGFVACARSCRDESPISPRRTQRVTVRLRMSITS
jgi:hypothetical protein